MTQQLAIEVPIEHRGTSNYISAMVEYKACLPLKYLAPVFFCYNGNTKQYFVSKIFKRETIESNYSQIKIIDKP